MSPRIPDSAANLARRRRKRKGRGDERGIALIMVLGAITVLTVFLTELQEQTSSELSAAISDRDALRAEYYARSAVNLARLLIAIEPEIRKSIPLLGSAIPQIPVWEFTDMVLGPFNDTAGAQTFSSLINADPATGKNLGMPGGGHFEIKIVDEDSKINLNTAAKGDPTSLDRVGGQLLSLFLPVADNALFEGRDMDNQFSDRQTICGAIVDWADDNEVQYACDPRATGPSAGGAEDNFYQTIGQRYQRKNAPFDSLEELHLVRGVSDDFWSTFVDPDPTDPHKRIMTVYGLDKININTANAQTLLAVICTDPGAIEFCNDPVQLQSFLMAMSLIRSFTRGAPIFSSTKDFIGAMQGNPPIGPILLAMQVKPFTFKQPNEVARLIGLKSQMFSIYADGVIPGRRKTTKVRIHATIDFRSAAQLGGAAGGFLSGTGTTSAVSPTIAALAGASKSAVPAPSSSANALTTPASIMAAMSASPAGNVVYWRIE